MVTPDRVRAYIAEHLQCDHLEVAGDGHHFEAVIVSPLFRGKSRVQQHQLVNAALGDCLGGVLHALALTTSPL